MESRVRQEGCKGKQSKSEKAVVRVVLRRCSARADEARDGSDEISSWAYHLATFSHPTATAQLLVPHAEPTLDDRGCALAAHALQPKSVPDRNSAPLGMEAP
jgi:hypothetical protein